MRSARRPPESGTSVGRLIRLICSGELRSGERPACTQKILVRVTVTVRVSRANPTAPTLVGTLVRHLLTLTLALNLTFSSTTAANGSTWLGLGLGLA